MRGCFTAAVLNVLLEHGIYFDYVAGISAGANNLANYLTRDIERTRKTFVDAVLDKNIASWFSLLRGEGYFNTDYIYDTMCLPDGYLPFDMELFKKNPAQLRIGAYNVNRGETVYFTEDDIETREDLLTIVRASSTIPFMMPITEYKDNLYLDGGLANGGIPLDIAIQDGYEKFFVVCTQPRGFRLRPVKHQPFLTFHLRKHPHILDAVKARHEFYNRSARTLEKLSREGRALVVYPDEMPITYRDVDYDRLNSFYHVARRQGLRDVASWREFLSI